MIQAPGPVSSHLALDVDQMGVLDAVFHELVLRERALHSRSTSWPCSRILPLGESIASAHEPDSRGEVFRLDSVLVHARLRGGLLCLNLAAPVREMLDSAERALRSEVPPALPTDDAREPKVKESSISFWAYGAHGPSRLIRRVTVPQWEEIAPNYGPRTAAGLGQVMRLEQQVAGGQLMLWHGPPGTGKTHALRALGWEWREWCEMHYVVDPEVLLGERPDYLLSLLLAKSAFDGGEDLETNAGASSRPPWRMLILEDSGELLTADAKSVTGQALSRLLNLVDGLLGQGLRLLVLITTNEPVGRLHPAVSRAGRCLANVEFDLLSPEDARAWLTVRGISADVDERVSLANLYARADGRDGRVAEPGFGFTASS